MVAPAGVLTPRSNVWGAPLNARAKVVGALLTLSLPLLAGCTGAAGTEPAPAASASQVPSAGPSSSVGTAPSDEPAEPARDGKSGPTVRLRFAPDRVTLADGSHADVEPAATVDGILAVPTDVRKVGWWDGSAEAGDPFGSSVIAGHVDSKTQGLGYFARLRSIRKGEIVTVRGVSDSGGAQHTLRYQVQSIRSVTKGALSSDSAAFDQTGDHRLVLITCTGTYDPSRGGYQDNLVVVANPLTP